MLRKDYTKEEKEWIRIFEEELERKSDSMILLFPWLNYPYYKKFGLEGKSIFLPLLRPKIKQNTLRLRFNEEWYH